MAFSNNFFTGTAATADKQPQHQVQTQQQSAWWHPATTTNSLHTAAHILPRMDPPEDIIATDDRYYCDGSKNLFLQQQQNSMNDKYDVNAIVSSLSLRPPDPPGFTYSSLGKRKYDSRCNYDDEGGVICLTMPSLLTKKSKVSPPLPTHSTLSNARASASFPLSSTSSPTATSAPTTQQIIPLNVNSGGIPSTSRNKGNNLIDAIDEAEAVDSEIMSIDDSSSCSSSNNNNNNNNGTEEDQSDDNSSIVSESSIRNAMYQLVFGRLSMHSTIGSGGVGGGGTVGGSSKYDAVDSKIEDLIRRSRLEATIKGRKEKEKKNVDDWCEARMRSMASMSSSDMDMDDDDADSGATNTGVGGEKRHAVDDGWNPGHG